MGKRITVNTTPNKRNKILHDLLGVRYDSGKDVGEIVIKVKAHKRKGRKKLKVK